MKRLLFLAYHFPPTGGAGTQRSLKFARDLPACGYAPVVVTGPAHADGLWTPADASLAGEMPADLEVHRVPGPVPSGGGRAAAVARWLDMESRFARWWTEHAEHAALGAAADGGVDGIFATMSPYETGALAAKVARQLGRPWIADLRDPWALDEMRIYPSAAHRARDLSRMRRVLASAAAIVMNTPEAARRLLQRFPDLRAVPVLTITNGWDARDFAGLPPARDHAGLRIVHTGSLHTSMGERERRTARLRRVLGGAAPVDVLTRSHVYLLEAVRRLRVREPELTADLEVHLAGVLSEADRRVAVDQPVVLHGYLDHDRSVALLRSADLLFLPMQDLPLGQRATIVPGKTYEYLASGRPILAAVPDGDARDLLDASPQATVCRPRDIDAMLEAVLEHARRKRGQGSAPDVRAPLLDRYERGRLARDLARVLDDVLVSDVDAGRSRRSLRLVG